MTLTKAQREAKKATATAQAARWKAEHEARESIVRGRKCPQCGSGLKYNCTIQGWWQCEQFGNEQHRVRPQDAPCNFQIFV